MSTAISISHISDRIQRCQLCLADFLGRTVSQKDLFVSLVRIHNELKTLLFELPRQHATDLHPWLNTCSITLTELMYYQLQLKLASASANTKEIKSSFATKFKDLQICYLNYDTVCHLIIHQLSYDETVSEEKTT